TLILPSLGVVGFSVPLSLTRNGRREPSPIPPDPIPIPVAAGGEPPYCPCTVEGRPLNAKSVTALTSTCLLKDQKMSISPPSIVNLSSKNRKVKDGDSLCSDRYGYTLPYIVYR